PADFTHRHGHDGTYPDCNHWCGGALTPRPTGTRSKSAVFEVSKCAGRAGEIRTRGLLVPNQALCRAKLPPAPRDSIRQPRPRARLEQSAHGTSPMTVQPLLLGRHLAERLPRP